MNDPTERFTDRVNDYVKFRPGYPVEVVEALKVRCKLLPQHKVVDVGSGTGISCELFLRNGNFVTGVEPNAAMRAAAEEHLKSFPKFASVDGTAENTGLPSESVDFVLAAQAFHWFKPVPTRSEFRRILKPEGYALILFNDRLSSGSTFSEEYEALLNEFGTDYKKVKRQNVTEHRHREFLGAYEEVSFPNPQKFDFESLLGRLRSSSYAPREDHPRYEEMKIRLREIFGGNQKNGIVLMDHVTRLYYSRLL